MVIVLFILLSGKSENKTTFKRFAFMVMGVAFLLNLVWEVGQLPLFKDGAFTLDHIMFCALASVADAIIVLLLYYFFALIYKDPMWVKDFTSVKVILLMIVGGIGAILAEKRHLSEGNWAYAPTMPIIPFVDVGLSPVLQFMILPIIILYISYRLSR